MKKETLYSNIVCSLMASQLFVLVCDFLKKDPLNYLNIISTIGFFLSYYFMVYNGIKLLRTLSGRIPIFLFLIGIFLVIGGMIADVAATVICSPSLDQEGNLFLRMLLDIKCPLILVYSEMALLNIMEVSLDLVLFACFLKVYPTLIQSIPYKNIFTTLKWIWGMGTVKGWKAILFGKLDFRYFIPSLGVMLVVQSLYRFYMALMWFNQVPYSYYVVPILIGSTSFLGLACFTHYKVKRLNLPPASPLAVSS